MNKKIKDKLKEMAMLWATSGTEYSKINKADWRKLTAKDLEDFVNNGMGQWNSTRIIKSLNKDKK